jgi:uncharacterized protein YndB with AHSA1/START domain
VATFAVARDVDAPARNAWELVTDWTAHSRWVALTRVTVTRPTGGVGTRFVGRTGVGPLGFDDPMEVVRWEPPAAGAPGTCTVRKLGRVVLGWAQVRVTPVGPARARVEWTEDVDIAPVAWTAWAGPLVAAAGRLAFRHVLRRVAEELADARPAGGHRGG